MWNKRDIAKPPNYTIEYTVEERESKCIDDCVIALKKGLTSIEDNLYNKAHIQCFNLEARVLQKYLASVWPLQVNKFYGLLKKVVRCTKCWKEIRLNDYATNLSKMMPVIQGKLRSIRLPTRQMFEYLMMRMYGAFQLLITLEDCCRDTLPYLLHKFHVGHNVNSAMLFIAFIARLRILSLNFAEQLARLYDDMYPWIQHLKEPTALDFTPEYSPNLVATLKLHRTAVKTNQNIKKSLSTDMVTNKTNVLDIFCDDKQLELVNKMLAAEESENEEKLLVDLKFKRNAGKSSCIEKKKKKLKKSKGHHMDGLSGQKSPQNMIEFNSKKRTKNHYINSENKEKLLGLLGLFDGNLEKNKYNEESLASDTQCQILKCKYNNLADEDIGEVAKQERESVMKNITKKRKRIENRYEDGCKDSKSMKGKVHNKKKSKK